MVSRYFLEMFYHFPSQSHVFSKHYIKNYNIGFSFTVCLFSFKILFFKLPFDNYFSLNFLLLKIKFKNTISINPGLLFVFFVKCVISNRLSVIWNIYVFSWICVSLISTKNNSNKIMVRCSFFLILKQLFSFFFLIWSMCFKN